ncbi:hypothetical protein MDA_GLEAN10009830 [Myotis davidii]|uniref:Uncharacterized protein n=1 Tax=Myotis davidii TaxID=225400 RepID=L5M9K1_MYODS|nr:hypothetical protein MDA_GLEAN10009830 [Myotis davidii]
MGLEKLNILCLGEGVSKNLDMVLEDGKVHDTRDPGQPLFRFILSKALVLCSLRGHQLRKVMASGYLQ